MGRRKIEIKAIKDDRNRSVTFLKRKGGLFKKAHELSVLCSVDVAVFVFGNNKKLYEYSSIDMRELIARYQYHGGPSEHKGPSDFNGGANDDDDDDDADGTPPRGLNGIESHMLPPHFGGQTQPPPPPPFSQVRHHTASASPPMTNGGPFPGRQPHLSRGHTPQPPVTSRPASRGDMRQMAMGRGMAARQPVAPLNGPHPGMTYMNAPPPMYSQPSTLMPPGPPYAYQTQQPPQQTPFLEERRPSGPPSFASQQAPPAQSVPPASRAQPTASPPQPPHHQHPTSHIHHHPSPQPERRHLDIQHPPPPPPHPKNPRLEASDRPKQPFPNADMTVKKMPQRKTHSIFTPIEENRSILSLHLASFASDPPIKMEQVTAEPLKPEPGAPMAAVASASGHRSSSSDSGPAARTGAAAPGSIPAVVAAITAAAAAAAAAGGNAPSPLPARQSSARNSSVSSAADTAASPPAQSSNVKVGVPPAGGRARGPRLTVQIPDGSSEVDSATAGSISPLHVVESPAQAPPRHSSTAMVLPPPSPSAQTLLSAGAIGPPNPFARPPPQQNISGETPVSALPSRFLTNELLPSPNSFYPEWNLRAADSNTLPSPLNFTTPVVGVGPSFLRDDIPSFGGSNAIATSSSSTAAAAAASGSSVSVPTITTTAASEGVAAGAASGLGKRKSLEGSGETSHEAPDTLGDAKRLRVN